jgi:hypothetical protein
LISSKLSLKLLFNLSSILYFSLHLIVVLIFFPQIHTAIASSTSALCTPYWDNLDSSKSRDKYFKPVVLIAVVPNHPGTFPSNSSVFIANSSNFIGLSQNIFTHT